MTDQKPQQTLILVSPNGSRVFLIDAIKPEYMGWSLHMIDVQPQQQNGNGAQPEPMPEIEPANVD